MFFVDRGTGQIQRRFFWGGITMILVGAGLVFLAAERALDGRVFDAVQSPGAMAGPLPTAAAGSFALLAGILLLLVRSYLISSEGALRRVANAVLSHGGDLPALANPWAVANATIGCLDRYQADIAAAGDEAREEQGKRIRQITEAHKDLLTHHKFTKKMLQSHQSSEVFHALLNGVRDGFGFTGANLGVIDEKGDIVFEVTGNGDDRAAIRIPCWGEESLLARTVWRGNTLLVSSLNGQRHSREDRAILGEGETLLVPVVRKSSRKCSDFKDCGHVECPAYDLEEARCWIEGFSNCVIHPSNIVEEKRKECALCEMFASSAILVVRSHPDSRRISRETAGSILTLVNEAAIALELVELNEKTRVMSITDGLTGLANHREFYQSLRRELARAKRYGHSVSLLMVDVDDFKKFNDSHGHLAGDFALKKIAGILRRCVRANDVVARYGGEEFGLILPEATASGALMLAERIKTEISHYPFRETSEGGGHLTVSVGIYSSGVGDSTEERMVKFADEAVYLAKNSGKNRVFVKEHA
jgi:diguanylate cyclase (GGDEF)-like protein